MTPAGTSLAKDQDLRANVFKAVREYYDLKEHWPAESLERRKLLRAKIDAERNARKGDADGRVA